MLGHMSRMLELSYDAQHAEYLRPLAVPRHPSTYNVPFRPKDAWKQGLFGEEDLEGIIVDEKKDGAENRKIVLELLMRNSFWKRGKGWKTSKKMDEMR